MTRVRLRLDGRVHDVELRPTEHGLIVVVDGMEVSVGKVDARPDARMATVVTGGSRHEVERIDLQRLLVDGAEVRYALETVAAGSAAGTVGAEGAQVRPPMPGKVVAVRVTPGEVVDRGQVLVVLEAMKMQNEITSPAAGIVVGVRAAVGAVVDVSDVLVMLGPLAPEDPPPAGPALP